MKRIVATSAVLALLAGTAFAGVNQVNEHPGEPPTAVISAHKGQVQAGVLHYTKDMVRLGLKPHDLVDVTYIPTSGIIDRPSRDD